MSEPTEEVAKPRPKSSAAVRTIILLLLLLVVVAAGLWDWYGAKEPRDKAYDRVLALQGSTPMYDPTKPATTQADVHDAIGVEPAESTAEDGVIYERFSWRRGIPWMTYDIWVLYRGEGDKEMLVALEDERPDPLYAANARGGRPPMPDPATVVPSTTYPAPPAEGEAASGDDAATDKEPADKEAADKEPAEGSETETPAPAETDKPTAPEGGEEAPAEKPESEADATETPAAPAEGEKEAESL